MRHVRSVVSFSSNDWRFALNWFPITCAYRWEERIVEEAETVLLVKTQPGYRDSIEQVIRQHISYTNFIGEIAPESVNESFLKWLNAEVPVKSPPAQ
jgi:periplasmic divalent cation tolerance protein